VNRLVRMLDSPHVARWLFNLYPPYLMTGIVVRDISPDWRRVRVEMGLHWYNRNYFGTHFGASLYAMTDPFLAIMLVRNLGPGYIVWDQAAKIEFLRPGRGRVAATFLLEAAMIDAAREGTRDGQRFRPQWPVEVYDVAGEVVARVHKRLYVRRKSPQAAASV
jgi:acyl-coenzyme A thioesterase PaaI-like protein